MKTLFKLLGALLLIGFLLMVGAVGYLEVSFPKVKAAPKLTVNATAAKIERGKYLAYHVCACIDCHSTRDWTKLTGPLVEGTEGKGGETFDQTLGFPGSYHARNITPASLSTWTDGEIYRAITCGVSKDGTPLFSVMPYLAYSHLCQDDVESIIAYIRTLKPIENKVPASESDFPMNMIIKTIPQQSERGTMPDRSDTLNYGKYLVTAAACRDCHTQMVKGQYVEGMEFAGGFEFKLPNNGTVRSANITPDMQTGIGNWNKEFFIAKFKAYSYATTMPNVKHGEFQSVMPWSMYGGMTEEDLAAIYKYLHSLKPINNQVEKFTPLAAK